MGIYTRFAQQPTQRQSAFDENLSNIAQGLGAVNEQLKQQQLTDRQMALDAQNKSFQLQQAGYDVSPQDILASVPQQPTGFQALFAQAEPAKNIDFSKRTKEYQDKVLAEQNKISQAQADRDWERNYKLASLGNTQAQNAFERNYKNQALNQQKELELAKLENVKPTQNEYVAAGYAKRARLSMADLENLPENIGAGKFDNLPYIPSALKSEDRKKLENIKNNFISAVLRKESGASISPTEREAEEAKYFAQAGDSPDVLNQKKRLREQAVLNLEAEGARALPRVGTVTVPVQEKIINNGNFNPIKDAYANDPTQHPNAQQALDWARKNPSNPDAIKIINTFGAKQ